MRNSLDKEILKLAAPAIVNNVTVPLLGLCDTAVAGHLGSSAALGAIAVGSMMLNVFFWLAGFLRMGTTGLTARAFGARNIRGCAQAIRKSLLIAAAISAVVLALQIPIRDLLLRLIAPDSAVETLAGCYYDICIWSVPPQLAIMAVSGWFIGMQTTVVPMTIAIGINIVNIILSLSLTFGIGLGFSGIASGTLAANWIGAIAAIIWMRRRFSRMRKEMSPEASDPGTTAGVKWRELFAVNGCLFVRSACIMAVTLAVTATGARLGEITLGANAIIMQFFLFFSYFMDGFAFSGEAMVGKYSGAEEPRTVKRTVIHLLKWGAGMALIFTAVYALGSGKAISLLTDNTRIAAAAADYRLWIMLLPSLTVAAFIFDGIFIGLTRTRAMMTVTIAGALIFFAVLFASGKQPDNNRLWLGFELYLLTRGALLGVWYSIFERKTLNLLIKKQEAAHPASPDKK